MISNTQFPFQIIYIVATDSPVWCKARFSKLKVDPGSIFYTVDWYPNLELSPLVDPVHFDLAVLAAANHSIFDYGTFGFWGAYLAGGITVIADVASDVAQV